MAFREEQLEFFLDQSSEFLTLGVRDGTRCADLRQQVHSLDEVRSGSHFLPPSLIAVMAGLGQKAALPTGQGGGSSGP
jgi:hypothetical protein